MIFLKILVVGGGGREHAIIKKIKENKRVSDIYALPGNGGISYDATCIPIKATDIEQIVNFAKENKIDFAIVAPDDPLVMGAVDELAKVGIPAFGPSAAAAAIEGSKAFSKDLMKKYHIPTADYQIFDDPKKAIAYLEEYKQYPVVIKADGLALGKGVFICENLEEAKTAVKSIMEDLVFGKSGNKIVIEEFLEGPEVSVLSFTDGKTLIPMVSSMDHKRALDDDKGLNTGGMGTVAPNPVYTKEVAKICMDSIFLPTINAMKKEGRTFKGCLYFGLMITKKGPKVIEYNCRFGDPETQVVLPLLKTDLLDIMQATVDERLSEINVEFFDKHACCVIMASGGYPQKYEKGIEIKGLINGALEGALVYHAGTALRDGALVTNGGRVLGVTAVANTLESAIEDAYKAVKKINFTGVYYRKDIGKRALLISLGK